MRVDLLCVEGVHDVAFVQRLLRAFGFEQKERLRDIPDVIGKLVPRAFPTNKEGNIHRRVDVPAFHHRSGQWVILHGAGSDSQLVDAISYSVTQLHLTGIRPAAIGMILDGDDAPSLQFARRQREWERKKSEDADSVLKAISFPQSPGEIVGAPSRFGVFVMPDNGSTGKLESVLLKQGKAVYPALHGKAVAFIDDVRKTPAAIPAGAELKSDGRNEGKAILHAMTSVLKPGRTLQASISDHAWVPSSPADFPVHIQPISDFLKQLLELEPLPV